MTQTRQNIGVQQWDTWQQFPNKELDSGCWSEIGQYHSTITPPWESPVASVQVCVCACVRACVREFLTLIRAKKLLQTLWKRMIYGPSNNTPPKPNAKTRRLVKPCQSSQILYVIFSCQGEPGESIKLQNKLRIMALISWEGARSRFTRDANRWVKNLQNRHASLTSALTQGNLHTCLSHSLSTPGSPPCLAHSLATYHHSFMQSKSIPCYSLQVWEYWNWS